MEILLAPPLAFLIYLGLVGILAGLGRIMAGPEQPNELKSSVYAGGELSPTQVAAPGYRPFFVIALFFAVVHLGILMLGSADLSPIMGVYLVGLLIALVALILG